MMSGLLSARRRKSNKGHTPDYATHLGTIRLPNMPERSRHPGRAGEYLVAHPSGLPRRSDLNVGQRRKVNSTEGIEQLT